MCDDFVFVRSHLLAFHFIVFQTKLSRVQFPSKLLRAVSVRATIGTSKVDIKWFALIGNQDCNRTKGTSFYAIEPHFGYNPDCFDYEGTPC